MDLFKDILLKMEEEKSPAPGAIQTHDLSVMRSALYSCATTVAHILVIVNNTYLQSTLTLEPS